MAREIRHLNGDPTDNRIENLEVTGSDPFGEHDASITHLSSETLPGPTLERSVTNQIPTNPTAFNEMASYFGAAGTIMSRFCNAGRDYVSADELYSQIQGVWGSTNGKEFCGKVMGIVLCRSARQGFG